MAAPETPRRTCSKQMCNRDAVCTLTYVYSDSTAVIGALSARREPHAYDLCPVHADSLTAPKGWRVVRLESPDGWNHDDLDAVVEAVRPDEDPAPRRTARGTSLGAVRPPGAARPSGPSRSRGPVLRDVSYRGRDTDTRADGAADSTSAGGSTGTVGPTGIAGPTGAAGSDGSTGRVAGSEGPAGSVNPEGARAARHVPMGPSPANTGYSVTTRSIANANAQVGQRTRSVPLPAALRTPHWRRP
ncbi:DUF3499 family protein [Kocuria marina]|uniref:DUF3499 family protein n=1 Tax=Kocuria marina TaxID=223184 RepID=UPI0022E0DEF1|nr:DUF3499 family protein [Kocuria marina]